MIVKEAIEAGVKAGMTSNGCGVMLNGERVMCDDPRLGGSAEKFCICREDCTAAITAALAAMPAQEERQNYNCPCAHQSQCDSSCLTLAPSLAAGNERLRDVHDDGVKFGIALSIAFLLRDRDEPVIAEEWWGATGMTIEACERIGLDEYDLDPIRAALEDRT